jgi:hypothetical protein
MSSETEYRELLRDLAWNEPRHGYCTERDITLTNTQAAIVLRRFPDLMAVSLAGSEETIARLMEASESRKERWDVLMGGIAAEVVNRVRAKAPDYIWQDVRTACDELAEQRRIDQQFVRQAV